MHNRIGVVVVDDEPALRRSWEHLLNAQADLACVGTLPTADDLAEKLAHVNARVVLLDISLPGADPFEAMVELNQKALDCRVVVCTGYTDQNTIDSAIDAGAWGFVDKLAPPSEVLNVIRRVAQGEVSFPRGMSR
ncbi:MAG TPA: response regulator transcription factor [Phycisphaerales bacterium]|nr:response regulator transcription factor [Phycisphaerales bacterium]